MEKVFKLSSEENLQPFKDNMDMFLSQGQNVLMISTQDVSKPVRVLNMACKVHTFPVQSCCSKNCISVTTMVSQVTCSVQAEGPPSI